MNYAYKIIQSPAGDLKLVASDEALVAILWENDNPKRVRLGTLVENCNHPVFLETERQLKEYFQGKRKTFSLKLDLIGTKFQNDVWQMLLAIPFGETGAMVNLRGSLVIHEPQERSEPPMEKTPFRSLFHAIA